MDVLRVFLGQEPASLRNTKSTVTAQPNSVTPTDQPLRTIPFAGLTRDGTFLIENGKVTRPIKNMRWNESPIFVLNNLEMLGRPERVSSSESGSAGAPVIMPPIKARDFTSASDAV
jgi:hypothetical protein